MRKIFIIFPFIMILLSGIILTSSSLLAEKGAPATPAVKDSTESTPPPLMRNPFVDAPYGRMNKATVRRESNTEAGINKDDDKMLKSGRTEDMNKVAKVRGVMLGGDHPEALVDHRVVKIGDVINGLIVTDITGKGVSLSNGDRVIQLPFE